MGSDNLDDVTLEYRLKEDSYGCGKHRKKDRRMLRSGRRLSTSPLKPKPGSLFLSNTSLRATVAIGPSASDPVIVYDKGHYFNTVYTKVALNNTVNGTASQATCIMKAYVVDYRGLPYENYTSALVKNAKISKTVAANALDSIDFQVTYSDYSNRFTSEAEPYALKVTLSCVDSSGSRIRREKTRRFCNPSRIVYSNPTETKVICKFPNHGDEVVSNKEKEVMLPKPDVSAMLSSCKAQFGSTLPLAVGDGTCHDHYNTNGCWDLGDCCVDSCKMAIKYSGNAPTYQGPANDPLDCPTDTTNVFFDNQCCRVNDTATCGFSYTVPADQMDFAKPLPPVHPVAVDNGECSMNSTLNLFKSKVLTNSNHYCAYNELRKLACFGDDGFDILFDACSKDVETFLMDTCQYTYVPQMRCPFERTQAGCLCKNDWTLNSKTYHNRTYANADQNSIAYLDTSKKFCEVDVSSCGDEASLKRSMTTCAIGDQVQIAKTNTKYFNCTGSVQDITYSSSNGWTKVSVFFPKCKQPQIPSGKFCCPSGYGDDDSYTSNRVWIVKNDNGASPDAVCSVEKVYDEFKPPINDGKGTLGKILKQLTNFTKPQSSDPAKGWEQMDHSGVLQKPTDPGTSIVKTRPELPVESDDPFDKTIETKVNKKRFKIRFPLEFTRAKLTNITMQKKWVQRFLAFIIRKRGGGSPERIGCRVPVDETVCQDGSSSSSGMCKHFKFHPELFSLEADQIKVVAKNAVLSYGGSNNAQQNATERRNRRAELCGFSRNCVKTAVVESTSSESIELSELEAEGLQPETPSSGPTPPNGDTPTPTNANNEDPEARDSIPFILAGVGGIGLLLSLAVAYRYMNKRSTKKSIKKGKGFTKFNDDIELTKNPIKLKLNLKKK